MLRKNPHLVGVLKLSALVALSMGSYSYTAAKENWNIQLEPMAMGVGGANKHLATISTWDGVTRYYPPPSFAVTTTNYRSTEDKNFMMGFSGTFRGQIEYMTEKWGIGISGWGFDTSDTINVELEPSTFIAQESSLHYHEVVYSSANNPFIWDFGNKTKITAKNQLGVWSVDTYAIRKLFDSDSNHINLTFGAKFGAINNYASEVISTNYSFPYHFSEDRMDANILVGPSLGIHWTGKYHKHRLEGTITESALFGNVDRAIVQPSPVISGNMLFVFNRSINNTQTVTIPVTEFKIKYLYDFAENISLGIGFFTSFWMNAPSAPKSSQDVNDTKDLMFYGGLASINFRY